MEYEAKKIYDYSYNNRIDCSDARYLNKCQLTSLHTIHKGFSSNVYDKNFIMVVNQLNKLLKINEKQLNTSDLPEF